VHTNPRQQTAKALALLPQHNDDMFPATVMETALAGRHPHVASFRWESANDFAVTRSALQTVGIAELANRNVLTLSGGERRRLAIAQVLAQQPSVFLLDEPTNHLDPQHEIETLAVFRKMANEGATVIASLHDANLASRFADRCLLLYGDGRWDSGPVDAVLEAGRLSRLYATSIEAVPWRGGNLFVATGAER
jgi:iron complex transport system ATP-binding protein